ncbi:MAG TPA: hypothetical protein VFV58_29250 [Blastocatellia bacterium]|jgi:hypothetical protein|nr:hypothetical protein [Blastocatellia bacterium]
MIEYWAALGLAIIDHEFLESLVKAKKDGRKLRGIVKDYGFRLSRYELGELQRVINSRVSKEELEKLRRAVCDSKDGVDIPTMMETIHDSIWYADDPCWPAMTPNTEYRHPYLVPCSDLDHDGKPEIVPGFVDPVTGKPLKTKKRKKAPSHSMRE